MPTNTTLATNDPQILLQRIKNALPELVWESYQFIDAGWDHEVIQLDDNYIFRFPNSPEYLALLQDEIALLSFLGSRVRAHIPNYMFIADDYSFGGYKMLPGKELSLDLFNTLSSTQQAGVAQTIADFLSDLHSIETAELVQFHVSTEPNFAGYSNVATEASTYLQPRLSVDDYRTVEHMLKDIATAQAYGQPARLTHGDLAPKHLIWDNATETVGFIDFSDRTISDPAYDFAELYTYGAAFVDTVYGLYKGPDKNGQFLDRAKAYMKAIGIHSLANTYQTQKMKKDEALRLFDISAHL